MMAALIVGVFVLPSGSSAKFSPFWFAAGLALFFTAWTTALVPYAAHGGEITTDYDRRSRMNLRQSLIGIIATLVTYGVPYLLVDKDTVGLRQALAGAMPNLFPFNLAGDWLRAARPRRASPTTAASWSCWRG